MPFLGFATSTDIKVTKASFSESQKNIENKLLGFSTKDDTKVLEDKLQSINTKLDTFQGELDTFDDRMDELDERVDTFDKKLDDTQTCTYLTHGITWCKNSIHKTVVPLEDISPYSLINKNKEENICVKISKVPQFVSDDNWGTGDIPDNHVCFEKGTVQKYLNTFMSIREQDKISNFKMTVGDAIDIMQEDRIKREQR